MSEPTPDDERLDPADEALARRLDAESPRPSPSLRRRVRGRVGDALGRKALRRRSTVLVASGALLLAVSLVLAVSGQT